MNQEKHPQNLAKQVLKAQAMVVYQDRAVVSKTILDQKSGSVTLFAFAGGEGLKEHTAPFDALVQVIDGSARITISGEDFILNSGEMVIMPAGEPHGLKALSPFKMILTMIKG